MASYAIAAWRASCSWGRECQSSNWGWKTSIAIGTKVAYKAIEAWRVNIAIDAGKDWLRNWDLEGQHSNWGQFSKGNKSIPQICSKMEYLSNQRTKMESAKRVSLVIEAWIETEMACKAMEVWRASLAIEVERGSSIIEASIGPLNYLRHLVGWIGWLA